MIEITEHTESVDISDDILIGCGEASVGFNQSWNVDWTKFWECLETDGWDMQDMGGRIHNQLQRRVQKLKRAGLIQ